MAISIRVTDITNQKIVPIIVDQTLDSNVFMARTFQSGVKSWNTGPLLQIPIQVSNPTTGGSYSGIANFGTALSNNTTKFSFEPKAYEQTVTIGGIEKSLNETTDAQAVSLVKSTMEIAQNRMTDQVGSLLYGLGSGDDFDGLGVIVDDSTATSTYGGLTRSTYPVINATKTAASGGVLSMSVLATLLRAVSAAGSGRQYPTLALTTEAGFDLYESLALPTVQSNYQALEYKYVTGTSTQTTTQDALKGTMGFRCLTYRGIPVVADEKQTSGQWHFLNENYLNWYSLKSTDLMTVPSVGSAVDGVEQPKGTPIQWRNLMMPTAQFAQIGFFNLMGQLVSSQPRRNGVLTGLTTV